MGHKKFSENLEKKGFHTFFFCIRLVYGGLRGGGQNGAVDGATTVSAPSIALKTWWKIGCFFYRVDGSTQKSAPSTFTPEYLYLHLHLYMNTYYRGPLQTGRIWLDLETLISRPPGGQ